MVIFHSYVKLPEGICIAIIIPWISHEIPGKSSAPSYRSQLIAVARPGREPGAGIGWKSELETAQNGREHDHKLSNSIKVGGNLFPENLPFVKHGIWGEKSWRYPLSRQIHSKLHWIYHKTWNFEGNEMATFTVEFTPGNEKNMSTWGKDRWVPRGSPCHRWNILKLSILPPHSGRCHVEKGSCFFSKIPERFQIDPFRTVGQSWCIGNAITRHFWRCPTYLKKMEIRIISPDGAGKHIPISMEIHGNHMGIHRMSMVFEKLPEGETANQSPKLRLPWRLIPIVCLSEICLSKCWFKREHVGYCWLFHNVKSAILDIVDYVSFICLFYLCCSWFLWYLFHHLCVCVCPKIE